MAAEDLTAQLIALRERLDAGESVDGIYPLAKEIMNALWQTPGYLDKAGLDPRNDSGYRAWDAIEDAWFDTAIERAHALEDLIRRVERDSDPTADEYVLSIARLRCEIATAGRLEGSGRTVASLLADFDKAVRNAQEKLLGNRSSGVPAVGGAAQQHRDRLLSTDAYPGDDSGTSDVSAARKDESRWSRREEELSEAIVVLAARIDELKSGQRLLRDQLTGGLVGTGAEGAHAAALRQQGDALEEQIGKALEERSRLERMRDGVRDELTAARARTDAAERSTRR